MKKLNDISEGTVCKSKLTKIITTGAIGLVAGGIAVKLGYNCYQFFNQTPPEIYAGIASGILSGAFGVFSLQYFGIAAKLMKK